MYLNNISIGKILLLNLLLQPGLFGEGDIMVTQYAGSMDFLSLVKKKNLLLFKKVKIP